MTSCSNASLLSFISTSSVVSWFSVIEALTSFGYSSYSGGELYIIRANSNSNTEGSTSGGAAGLGSTIVSQTEPTVVAVVGVPGPDVVGVDSFPESWSSSLSPSAHPSVVEQVSAQVGDATKKSRF